MSKVPTHFTLYQTLISKLSDYYTKPIQDVREKLPYMGLVQPDLVNVTRYTFNKSYIYVDVNDNIYFPIGNNMKLTNSSPIIGHRVD